MTLKNKVVVATGLSLGFANAYQGFSTLDEGPYLAAINFVLAGGWLFIVALKVTRRKP